MQIQRSPGGSLFPYYYKNGELFCLHFGSYLSDEDGLIAMIHAEETFLCQHHRQMGIWIDFYETNWADRILEELVGMLQRIRPYVTKLAIVGCPLWVRWKLSRRIKKTEPLGSLPVKYFQDPEIAKTWLVSEF